MPSTTGSSVAETSDGSRTLLPYDLPVTDDTIVRRAEQTLDIHAVQHIGVRVNDIRRAEAFYYELFQMDVLLRARRIGERWEPLPADLDWDEGIRTGIYPDLVHLRHGPLELVLLNAGRGAVLNNPALDHLSLRVSPGTLATMRATALVRSFPVRRDEPRSFQFRDPYGIEWHLTDEDA